jgi:hypothetical protein
MARNEGEGTRFESFDNEAIGEYVDCVEYEAR